MRPISFVLKSCFNEVRDAVHMDSQQRLSLGVTSTLNPEETVRQSGCASIPPELPPLDPSEPLCPSRHSSPLALLPSAEDNPAPEEQSPVSEEAEKPPQGGGRRGRGGRGTNPVTLKMLTQKVMQLFAEKSPLSFQRVAELLREQGEFSASHRRRLYDVMKVLESLSVLRLSANQYQLTGLGNGSDIALDVATYSLRAQKEKLQSLRDALSSQRLKLSALTWLRYRNQTHQATHPLEQRIHFPFTVFVLRHGDCVRQAGPSEIHCKFVRENCNFMTDTDCVLQLYDDIDTIFQ